jgi:hypothetical protein
MPKLPRWTANVQTNTLAITIVAIICLTALGCGFFPESSFDLAPESRLPSWFTIPARLSRSDVKVTMDYYIGSEGGTATFTLRNVRTGSKIAKVEGTLKGSQPLYLENTKGRDIYPSYEIITVGRTTEVIEHRKMEPVFYVTDDTTVLSKLGVSK